MMKKLRLFIRKLFYAVRKTIPAIIKEFNSKDGYTFRTNFDIKDEPFYISALDKLGADYRVSNHATDYLERPLKWCQALYVKGDFNWDKFTELYRSYADARDRKRYEKGERK